ISSHVRLSSSQIGLIRYTSSQRRLANRIPFASGRRPTWSYIHPQAQQSSIDFSPAATFQLRHLFALVAESPASKLGPARRVKGEFKSSIAASAGDTSAPRRFRGGSIRRQR